LPAGLLEDLPDATLRLKVHAPGGRSDEALGFYDKLRARAIRARGNRRAVHAIALPNRQNLFSPSGLVPPGPAGY
jgi:hypothetical protein